MNGRVTLIGAGPGDADLITIRGYRALQAADVVLYDHLVDETVLEGLSAERIYVGKRCGEHAMAQEQIIALMIRLAAGGLSVARLKGGDPTVFGRGAEEAAALVAEGVEVSIVPGVTSAVSVPTLAGIPVTHRGVADSFAVVTAHRRFDEADFSIPPFSPRTTVVLLMGVGTISVWVTQMLRTGYPEDLPVAFVVCGASSRQRVVETTLGNACRDAAASAVESPAVAVVGKVVRLRDELRRSVDRRARGAAADLQAAPADGLDPQAPGEGTNEEQWKH